MLPEFLVAVLLITLCCLILVKAEPLTVAQNVLPFDRKRALPYLLLFAPSVAIVFRGVPYWIGLIVIPATLLLLDRKALHEVDYQLLCTFVCFFIFSGNLARIGAVRTLFSSLLSRSTFLFGILSCQCISNVPSAILLSRFTDNYRSLLVAVDIGGAGTLIASLASLITFREYLKDNPGKAGKYLLLFSVLSFSSLAILTLFSEAIGIR